jgi:hypothetical protein
METWSRFKDWSNEMAKERKTARWIYIPHSSMPDQQAYMPSIGPKALYWGLGKTW